MSSRSQTATRQAGSVLECQMETVYRTVYHYISLIVCVPMMRLDRLLPVADCQILGFNLLNMKN